MKHWHDSAPKTRRSARHLSRVYGYKNPRELAESLPENAVVADFGSAYSKFGRKIVTLRDDISWFNIDPMYANHGARLQRKAPPGLQHVAGSVFQPPLPPGSCDRVFSSALLPHIVMSSPELGGEAVTAMAELLAEDGELGVANFVNHRTLIGWHQKRGHIAVIGASDFHTDPEAATAEIVSGMQPLLPTAQKVINTIHRHSPLP